MPWAFGDDITLVTRTRTGADSYGNDTFTTTSTVVRGAYNPGTSSEVTQGLDQVTTQPTIYLPPDTILGPIDKVIVRGQPFEVDGSPNTWVHPATGRTPGVEVKLKQVTG